MNLIEALKAANGKPIRRRVWTAHQDAIEVSEGGARLLWDSTNETYAPQLESLLADDWYVVEPKSKIEEAIEREAYDERNNPVSTPLSKRMCRIVNLTLDEAMRAMSADGTWEYVHVEFAKQRIDALKVKE